MILTIKNIITACIFILLPINALAADTRVFFEGGEATSYTTHFLEDQFGSSESTYWAEFIDEVWQSDTIYHGGSHSLYYDPYANRNPYAQIGVGSVAYGNLSDFALSDYHNRYWYFRWYFRLGTDNSTGGVGFKIFYIGCGGDYLYIAKTQGTDSGFIYNVNASQDTGWPSASSNLRDDQWHKFEVFIDFGTGSSNASVWSQVDDSQLFTSSGISYPNPAVTPPISNSCIAWPSNCTACTGSQDVYLDDMEVWVLDAALSQGDTEPLYGAEPTPQPTTQASGNFTMPGN